MRKRRHEIATCLLRCLTEDDVVEHFKRMDGIIREGTAKDAILAFRALYELVAVRPGQEFKADGKVSPGTAAKSELHPPVIVLSEPPPRVERPGPG